jgi:hypothetical protein
MNMRRKNFNLVNTCKIRYTYDVIATSVDDDDGTRFGYLGYPLIELC